MAHHWGEYTRSTPTLGPRASTFALPAAQSVAAIPCGCLSSLWFPRNESLRARMPRVRLRIPRLAALALAVLCLAACEVGVVQTAIANPTPDAAPPPPASCAPPVCERLDVQIGDFAIVPARITASAPRVQLAITNVGAYTHSLEVRTPGGTLQSPRIGPNQTGYLEADLAPGEYEALDPTLGHAVRGARATIVIAP